jgi:hypothetical protein
MKQMLLGLGVTQENVVCAIYVAMTMQVYPTTRKKYHQTHRDPA